MPPHPGQLVTVRQRRYIVRDVQRGVRPPKTLASMDATPPQHLVRLQSVEDDGLGEELQVIWEMEPGAQIHERATLPDPGEGFDDPVQLDAFLDAVHWGAVASADVRNLHAPFRSAITIEDYQLDPLARALRMPRVSLLIADDVGLGKTIEAGLVAQELLLRNRARSVLVVCPAERQIQWHDQMRDKFGLEFRIVDGAMMKNLRRRRGLHVNPWTHFPRLITSIDFLKRERQLRRFREVLPPVGQPTCPRKLDLLIVDEAHHVAPSGGRGSLALDSDRTFAIRTLAPHFEHKIFLTATPHNGCSDSFSALLELLDDQRFHRGCPPDEKQKNLVMIRRVKSELPPDDLGRPRFPKRQVEVIEVDYTDEERQAYRWLQAYTKQRSAKIGNNAESLATEFLLKLLKKRMLSSPEALRITLEQHLRTLRRNKEKMLLDRAKPTLRLLRREVAAAAEENADDDANEQQNLETVTTTTLVMRPPTGEELEVIDKLHKWTRHASGRADAKAQQFIRWLNATLQPGGKWNNERVIVITEYRATQSWLRGLLVTAGLARKDRLLTLYGGMPNDEREAIKAAFQASPKQSKARILLATDAASEGIDLQNHCNKIIHYEIPWNPNRMEQRNGRVDRYGQRSPAVYIHHFVGKGYVESQQGSGRAPGDLEGDLEFLMRAAVRANQIREDLGNASKVVADVVADQVEEAMLGKRKSLDTDRAKARAREARTMLRLDRMPRTELNRLHARLDESRNALRLLPDNIRSVVKVGLALAGHPPLEPVQIPGRVEGMAAIAYKLPALSGSWVRCAEGLSHPHTQEIRPLVFDHKLAAGRDDVVLAHLNHRLVQMCLRLLRAELWAPEASRKLHRVSARVVASDQLEHPVVLAHARLVVLGSNDQRLHEEMLVAGGVLRPGQFAPLDVGEVKAALDASREPSARPASQTLQDHLASLWPSHADALINALDARQRDRMAGLDQLLHERATKEAKDLEAVLAGLRKRILDTIDAFPRSQLELFSDLEREQIERNRHALRVRADVIPSEIAREKQAIQQHYANPVPKLFPAAVGYLIPEGLDSERAGLTQ